MFMSPVVRSNRGLFSEFNRMQNEFEQLFNIASKGMSDSEIGLEVWSSGEQLVVKAELPGIDPKDIKTTVHANQLIIEADSTDKKMDAEKGRFLRRERRNGILKRTLRLPYDVENDKITAEYKYGVLTVTLPRAEVSKPRSIAVKSA